MKAQLLDRLDAMHARLHGWRWWVRLVLATVLVPYCARFAYVRMTTLPANAALKPSNLFFSETPEGDPTKDLQSAIAKIPEAPRIPCTDYGACRKSDGSPRLRSE